MSQLKHPWPEHSNLYRPPGDFHAPWMAPSAPNQIPAYYLSTSKRAPWNSEDVRRDTAKEQIKLKRDCARHRTIVSTRQKGTCARFWTSFKGLFPGGKKKRAKKLDAHTLPFINIPHDRRNACGGYVPHPVVTNRVQVRNSTFRCSSSVTINPDDLWSSLRSVDDSWRLGNWPGGSEHAALHPRPYDWPKIQYQLPIPPCHNVRLNSYLQHRCNGPHPISFDIALGPNRIIHNTHASSSTTSLDPAHYKQLATHPPVRQMHIQGVAEDPLPHFPWLIEVENTRGITCGDVFDAIARKFLEYVTEEEYNSWTKHRKTVAALAYHQRVRTPPVGPARPDEVPDGRVHHRSDGLRRIDYMGAKVIFHGLEQASTMMDGTWFMYVGAGERSNM